MKPLLLSMVLLVVTVGCAEKAVPADVLEDDHSQIHIGTTKFDVLRILGPPTRKRDDERRDMPGFGFPSWWHTELALGDKVEIWDYYDAGRGTDTIYFLKGSDKVGHTRFVREGVVF